MSAFVQSGQLHAKLDHLQLMELNSVRPLLPMTLDKANEMEAAAAKVRRTAASSSSNRSQGLNSSSVMHNNSSYNN